MEATSIFGVDILFLLSVASLCVDDLAQCDLAVARRSGILVDAWIDHCHFPCFLPSGRGSFLKNQVSTEIIVGWIWFGAILDARYIEGLLLENHEIPIALEVH